MKKEKLKIIYQDKFIIVVEKPTHLLTISTENEKEKTMFHKVWAYEKKKNKNNRIFIVHRLDKDTSGLLVFAKSEKVKYLLQENWGNLVKKRGYIAVVEGKVEKEENTIKTYLKEGRNFITYSTNSKKGKLAITNYRRIKINKKYTLLDINILTGRKNQIRVHMQEIGYPIVGDKKYGAKTNPLKRLGLHANLLVIVHPITKEIMTFTSNPPKEFIDMFKNE